MANALALSALLLLIIKLTYGFFAWKIETLPQFTGDWMTVFLVFSFLILNVVFFLKDSDEIE